MLSRFRAILCVVCLRDECPKSNIYSPLRSYQKQKSFHCHSFTALSRCRQDFSCLLSHPSDRVLSTQAFLVSEATEQTLLLTKHWTKRWNMSSLPNLNSRDTPSLSFMRAGGTKSLFWQSSSTSPELCLEFSHSSPNVMLVKLNKTMEFE